MRDHYFIWWTTEAANSPMSGYRAGMLYRDCIPAGLTSREGGCRYPEGKASWVGDKGICDCADYLAGIEYLVFDKKKVTMAQLLEAMDANWEGHEDIRQMCLKAPKYGNDDDYADRLVRSRVAATPRRSCRAGPTRSPARSRCCSRVLLPVT